VRLPVQVQVSEISAPCFKGDPWGTWDLRRRMDITPVKDPQTRIKPLALASGQRPRPFHNRHTRTGAFVRWETTVTHSHYKFITASFTPKRSRNGRFASETAHWAEEWFKMTVKLLKSSRCKSFSRRGQWAWLYKFPLETGGLIRLWVWSCLQSQQLRSHAGVANKSGYRSTHWRASARENPITVLTGNSNRGPLN
jgi:hypothetical protein